VLGRLVRGGTIWIGGGLARLQPGAGGGMPTSPARIETDFLARDRGENTRTGV